MKTHTSTATPERRSGRSAAERQHTATVRNMADSIIDAMIHRGRCEEADLRQYGFLSSEIADLRDEALRTARTERPQLFGMAAA